MIDLQAVKLQLRQVEDRLKMAIIRYPDLQWMLDTIKDLITELEKENGEC